MRHSMLLVTIGALSLLAPLSAAAQGVVYDSEASVASMIAALSESQQAATGQTLVILRSLETEPAMWPRVRADSLAEGVIEFLLEDRYPHGGGLLLLLRERNAGDGRPVGSFAQLVELFNADLRWFSRAGVREGDPSRVPGDDSRFVRVEVRSANHGHHSHPRSAYDCWRHRLGSRSVADSRPWP
jgi:hypothetical protein